MGRPPKPPEDKLVTLSVRVSRASLDLLNRIVEGETTYLQKRRLPTQGVHKSAAFRTIWELGELEYLLQRVTLWVTRRTNRYTVEQAAQVLGWKPEALRRLLLERGIQVPEPVAPPAPAAPAPSPSTPDGPSPEGGPAIDSRFLV